MQISSSVVSHTNGKCTLSGRPPCNIGSTINQATCGCEGNNSRVRTDDQRLYAIRTILCSRRRRWILSQSSRYRERTSCIVQQGRRVFWGSRGGHRRGHGRSCSHFELRYVVLRVLRKERQYCRRRTYRTVVILCVLAVESLLR